MNSAAEPRKRRYVRTAPAVAACALVLAGCGGAGDVGEQTVTPPIANAKALNHPFTEADGGITLRVRGGSEVRLSGKDSRGTFVPVLRYDWRPHNAAAEEVVLVKRNENTIKFEVPDRAGELQFLLTVTDGNGLSDDARVTVEVEEARDPDAFLIYAGSRDFTVVAVTDVASELASDVAFGLTIEQRISYTDLDGTRQVDFPLGRKTTTLTGSWLKENGTGGPDCRDARNPRFSRPLPSLVMDDVLEEVGQDHPELAIDPSRIDEAELSLRITLTPAVALPAGVQPGLCVLDANGVAAGSAVAQEQGLAAASDGVAPQAVVTLDQLLGAPTRARDTRASAVAYYRTIDDAAAHAAKATLSGWLAQAGFPSGSTDWGAMREALRRSTTGAHAVYLNNFDLGFGRDMYARLGACDDGTTPASLSDAEQGACDVYSVVINYGSLEAAARNLQPIVAVAMEHTLAPGSGARRITKFYTYAPDRQGDFRRVLSIDLDGRGEKFLPGACTVCHGGTPRGLDASDPSRYGNRADVGAAFLPWDLDSLLYSDTDPSFSSARDPDFPESERELAAKFTREAQESELKKLNHLAYLTYDDGRRYPLMRELLEGWYGGAGLPSASFDGGHVPQGWSTATAGNPADSDTIYLEVFARNCRSCHVAQVPGPPGSGQLAIGSYAEFVGAARLSMQLGSGRMPLARLTMDRFWLPQDTAAGGRSAAEVLAEHLRDDGNDATLEFGHPGPEARIEGLGASGDVLVRGASYRLEGRSSTLFQGDGYAWRLEAPAGSRARLSFADSATPTLLGVDEKGPYKVSLSVSGTAVPGCAEALADGSAATLCEIRERRDTAPVIETIADQDPSLPVPVDAGAGTPLAVGLQDDSPGDGTRTLRSVSIAANPAGITAAPCVDALAVCVSVPPGAVAPDPVPITVVVEDADGDVAAAPTSFGVYVPTQLTVRPCLREVPARPNDGSAYPAVMLDINDCVAGRGSRPLRFFDSKGVEIPDGRFQFTPPPGQMTVFVGAAPASTRRRISDDAARLDFHVEFADATAEDTDAAGTVEIRFVGYEDEDWSDAAKPGDAVSFTRLRTALSVGPVCGSCHSRPDSPIGFLGVDVQQGYERMRCGVDGNDPLATPYVVPGDPLASALYVKPTGQLNHGGRNLDLTGDAAVRYQAWPGLAQWIQLGAYDTELGTDLPCP